MSEVDRLAGLVWREEMTQVLDDHVRIVVGLQKPVGLVAMVLVDVVEGEHRLHRQVVASVRHADVDGRERRVLVVADEQDAVAAFRPRVAHVRRFLVQIIG